MKRTLGVTLVVGGFLLAIFTLLLGRQFAVREAQAVQELVRTLADSETPLPLPAEQEGAVPVSPVGVPPFDATRNRPLLPPANNKVGSADAFDVDPLAAPPSEPAGSGAVELKIFHLQNADASEALRVIQPLLPREAKFSADERTNSLIVSASADGLAVITGLLKALDDAPAKKRLPLPSGIGSRELPMTRMAGRPVDSAAPTVDQDSALDRQAKQLAARVRGSKEPEKSKLRAELELLTDKHFELRQQRRAAEIADMADRVDKLRVAHHRRQENKPDILKRRLADLLDEEQELKWDDTRHNPSAPAYPMVSRPPTNSKLPNLEGEWLVTLPAGFEFVGKIEKRPESCWSFQEMRNLTGLYQIEGETLKGVTTDPKEPRDYEWLIVNNDILVLTKAPQNIGSDYRGATLRRGAKPKASLDRSPLESLSRSELVLKAKLNKAQVVLASATAELERLKSLAKTNSVSAAEVQRAAAIVEEAKADVVISEAELEEAKKRQ